MSIICFLVNEEQVLIICFEQALIISFYQVFDIEVVIAIKITGFRFFFLPKTYDWNVIVFTEALKNLHTDTLVRMLCYGFIGVLVFCLLRIKLDSRDRFLELDLGCIYIVLFSTTVRVYVLDLISHNVWYHQFLRF